MPNANVNHPVQSDRRAARGTLFIAAGRGCSYLLGYIASVILARGLGPGDYGTYGVIISVLVWMEQIGRFTFPLAAAKLLPEQDDDHVAVEQTAFLLNLILFFILFAILWLAAPVLTELFQFPGGTDLFRIAAMVLPFFGAYVLYLGLLQGRREFASMAIADGLYSAAKLIGVLLLLVFWLSVPAALIVHILGSAGGLLFVMSRLSLKMRLPDNGLAGRLVRLALPFGFYMAVLQILGVLDLWALQALGAPEGEKTIGLYVAARNIAVVPSFILIAVSDVLLPSLSRAVAVKDDGLSRHYVQRAVRFLWILGLPVTLLFALTADELMTLLFSAVYMGSGQYLAIGVISAAFFAFIALFGSTLNARGESLLCGAILGFLIPLTLLLNSLLVPHYGAIGAAWSRTLSGLVGALIFGVLAYRRFGALFRLRTVLNSVVAALPMVVLASQLTIDGSLLLASYVSYLGIYALVLRLTGELTEEDLDSLPMWRWRRAIFS